MTSDVSDRLRQALASSKFDSAAELAKRLNWSEPTVRAHINGHRGVPAKKLAAYARALNVTPEWLLYGKEELPELPEDDNDAALLLVEYALTHAERPLSPAEKLQFVREMKKLVSDIRGSKL